MVRLPVRGSSIATPCRSQAELGTCLADLRVADTFDAKSTEEIYFEISAIVGTWMAEKGRLQSTVLVKEMVSISTQLESIAGTLSSHETGIRSAQDIEAVIQLTEWLALDPSVGSIEKAQELLASFVQQASRIAHAGRVVGVDLDRRFARPGRSRLDWYDEFTALLLRIALKAGVSPSWQKDRVTGEWSGWLFDAAQALETFLPEEMRSPTSEACGKRLERSQKRLGQRPRQNRVTEE
jgi:hypothetical protein